MQLTGGFTNDINIEGPSQDFDNLEIEFIPDDVKFINQGSKTMNWQKADEKVEVTDPDDSSKTSKVRKFSGGTIKQGQISVLTYENVEPNQIKVNRWWFTLGDQHGFVHHDDPFNLPKPANDKLETENEFKSMEETANVIDLHKGGFETMSEGISFDDDKCNNERPVNSGIYCELPKNHEGQHYNHWPMNGNYW